MKIQIDDYTIDSDGRCATLRQDMISPDTGNKWGRPIGHFPNVTQALCRMLEEKISESAAKDANALIAEIKVFTDKVSIPELLKAINQG